MPGLDVLSQAPPVLLIGDSTVGKRTLLDRLPGVSLPVSGNCIALDIDTKYYTARVRVQVAGGSSPSPDTEADWEAVVLVFDATREGSFNYVKAWADTAGHRAEAEIKLCVANKTDQLLANGTVKRPPWLEAAYDWCNRECFEYIEVASADPTVDARLELDGERQGVRRVLSALSAHVWPGLVMKDRPAAAAAVEPVSFDREGSEPAEVGEALQPGHADQHSAVAEPAEEEPATSMSGHVNGAQEPIPEKELEQEMDRFECLLSEYSSVRHRLQGLPDSERRSAAEALTLRLMSHIGLDAEDSSSDSDSLSGRTS